ncbi:MAG TPA: DUF4142 domain-containing protein [Lacunisphaera sp.]|nr:DUF4142 domain-containing protein [Lacunisphaera sp.]
MKLPYSSRLTLLAACAALLGASSAAAQMGSRPDPATPSPISKDGTAKSDRTSEKFIRQVSQLSSEALRVSQVASERAINEQVKTFANQVSSSSKSLQEDLDQLAQKHSVLVPTGKDAKDMADEERKWQDKDPKKFDEDYLDRVEKNCKDAIDELEDYSKGSHSDPDLVAFAEKHLSVLQNQLQQAKSLEKHLD